MRGAECGLACGLDALLEDAALERVKVCCIASVEEARTAIQAGADALGLVAAMPSGPGSLSDEEIAEIAGRVPPPVSTFLLTSERTGAAIAAHTRRTKSAAVQVVSHIDPREWTAFTELQPAVRRVQVIHVEREDCLRLLDRYSKHVHAFLLDSGRPGAPTPELGGTGRVHDWRISRRFVACSPLPVFLAGGLTPENVGEAMELVRPFGVDLCSGIRSGGRLDSERLRSFLAAVRLGDGLRN